MIVEFYEAHDKPAAGFADEHLEGLDHRLFKVLAGFGIDGIAVAHTYVVLIC